MNNQQQPHRIYHCRRHHHRHHHQNKAGSKNLHNVDVRRALVVCFAVVVSKSIRPGDLIKRSKTHLASHANQPVALFAAETDQKYYVIAL